MTRHDTNHGSLPMASGGLTTAVAMGSARFVRSSSPARVAAFAVLALWASTASIEALCVDVEARFSGSEPAPTLVESMKEEASWIWAPYGVRIEWPTANRTQGCPQPHVSFDVLVDRPENRPPRRPGKIVLGRTRLTYSTARHVPIYIDYGAIQRLLESLGLGRTFRLVARLNATPIDLGRALGRVLAHEIGHVILAAASHQPEGLMRRSFGPEDLILPERRSYTLSSAEVVRLRRRELGLNACSSAPVARCTAAVPPL